MKAEHNQMEKIEWRKASIERRKTALNGNGETLSLAQIGVAMTPPRH
jgi:hypothetical protein